MRLSLNGRELLFIDTPGHARHHYCIYDQRSQGCFTGDTFGLAYPPLARDDKSFIFPTTTPVQFDPDALHASIDRIMLYKPERMFLTHFGCLSDPQRAVQELHRLIGRYNLDDRVELRGWVTEEEKANPPCDCGPCTRSTSTAGD
mgnify:CR=1 FL=1